MVMVLMDAQCDTSEDIYVQGMKVFNIDQSRSSSQRHCFRLRSLHWRDPSQDLLCFHCEISKSLARGVDGSDALG